MPMPDAWNPNFPEEILYNAAVLDFDLGAGTRAVVGMTMGGSNFVEGRVDRDTPADGIRTLILGLSRVSHWDGTRFEGTIKQIPLSTFEKFSPGAVAVAAGTAPVVTTYTPAPAGFVFTAANLYLKPRLNYQLGTTGWAYIEFPYGKVAEFPPITAPDREEATMAYRMMAVVDPGAVGWTTKTPPFKLVTSID